MRNILTILLILSCLYTKATNYYVDAASGNDGNSGLLNFPWKSITKVNNFFPSFQSGDSILFHRGQTFYGCIIPTKSFTNGNPIKFAAYSSGANPIITGLVQIDSWTSVGTNLWEGTAAGGVDSSAFVKLNDCNLVLVNGVNTAMGRYPNANAATPWLTVASWTAQTPATGTIKTGTLTSTTSFPVSFVNGDLVTKAFNFAIVRYPIIQQSGNTLTYQANNTNVPNNGWGFFIENDSIATVLDQQNEWWYSRTRKKLRMYSVGSPASLNVQMATLDTLVYIYPTSGVERNNITFNGIDFIGSNRRTFFIADADNITIKKCNINFCGLYAIWGGTNAQGGETAINLIVDSCTINNVNSQGIMLADHFMNAYIGHNIIKNTGKLYGMFKVPYLNNGNLSTWSGAFGSIVLNDAEGTVIEYNLIDTSGYNGISFKGNNIVIHNNEVSHQNYRLQDGAAIYSQGYRANRTVTAGAFSIGAHYKIASIGTTSFTSIGASSNTIGVVFTATGAGSGTGTATTVDYIGCKIYNNIVHDGLGDYSGTNCVVSASNSCLLSQGIYCDENTINTRVYNNTSFNNPSFGIFSNSNSDCYFSNNTCYNNNIGQLLFQSKFRTVVGFAERAIRDTLISNIFVSRTGANNAVQFTAQYQSRYIGAYPKNSIDSFFNVLDSNIYARPISDNITMFLTQNTGNSPPPIVYSQYTLAQWKTFIQSVHPAFESHAAKSPLTITDVSKLSIIYNPTSHDSTVTLTGSFVDIKNVPRSGTVQLTAGTSMILISTGSQTTPVISWTPANYTYPTTFAGAMTASAGGVTGTYRYYNGAVELFSTTVLNAGTYSLTVNFTPNDGVTYTTATKTGVALIVAKKTETLAYTVLSKVYTGSALSPTITISPDASVTGLSTTYNGISTAPTNVGKKKVVTGLTNTNYQATSISTPYTISAVLYDSFAITKATATISITNLAQVFDNTKKRPTITTNPAGLTVLTTTYTGISGTTYGPDTTAPTLSGTYNVGVVLTNSNYNPASSSATMTISPSGATISLVAADLNQIYSGGNKLVRGVTNPVGQAYTVVYVNTNVPRVPLVWSGTDSVPRFVGTYNVTATVTVGGSQATGVLTIVKLTPTITWATPNSIIQGTALSSGTGLNHQINATASVTGCVSPCIPFVYRKASGVVVGVGTILPTGQNQITVTFTPSNIANINVATKTVTISVTAGFQNQIPNPPPIENK